MNKTIKKPVSNKPLKTANPVSNVTFGSTLLSLIGKEKIYKNPNHNSKNVLEVCNFSKIYSGNKKAVDNISFNIEKGEFHAFIGSNGAGKTTTIKAIIGGTTDFEGKIYINNVSNNCPVARKKIAYIPEDANFDRKFTLYDFVYWNAIIFGFNAKEAKQKTNDIIKILKLSKFKKRKPINFSSGEKKKTLLAQALIKNPDIFIMDEPAANLDPQSRESLFDIFKSLQKQGKTIFISSHILDEVGNYCDSATIIENGQIKASDKIENLKNYIQDASAFEVIVRPIDVQQFIAFIQKSQLNKSVRKINEQEFSINFNNELEKNVFLQNTAKNGIVFSEIKQKNISLKDIYNDLRR